MINHSDVVVAFELQDGLGYLVELHHLLFAKEFDMDKPIAPTVVLLEAVADVAGAHHVVLDIAAGGALVAWNEMVHKPYWPNVADEASSIVYRGVPGSDVEAEYSVEFSQEPFVGAGLILLDSLLAGPEGLGLLFPLSLTELCFEAVGYSLFAAETLDHGYGVNVTIQIPNGGLSPLVGLGRDGG